MNPYDPEIFRKRKQEIMDIYRKHGMDRARSFCVASGMPFIAFYTFLKEDYPEMSEECDKNLKSLKEFYGV